MHVVVVGATGNVGLALVRDLSAQPAVTRVTGVARRRPGLVLEKVTWATADILDADLDALFTGVDAVVHLAWAIQPARDRARTRAINVDGSRRVFAAAARAGVGVLVHASSVGAYSPGPHDRRVDETWPTDGIASSFYSVDKAAAERELDAVAAANPELRVVRLRPGIVMQREAAEEIRRLFLGPLVPTRLLRRGLVPVVPDVGGVAFQAVHADDLAVAYRLAVLDPGARGAYNVAAEEPLTLRSVARALRALPVPVPAAVARAAAAVSWRLRLQPTPPGWLDLGLDAPLMDTTRIREELGWAPRRSAADALAELLAGLRDRAAADTPPLAAGDGAGGPVEALGHGTVVEARGARLIAVADLPAAGVCQVRTTEHGVLAVGLADGVPFAVSNVCRHQFAKLGRGQLRDGCLECPLHRARYDVRTGEMVAGPQGRVFGVAPYAQAVKAAANAVAPLETFPVAVRDGVIVLT